MKTVLARSRFIRGYVPFAVRLWDGKYEDGKRVAVSNRRDGERVGPAAPGPAPLPPQLATFSTGIALF